MPDKIPIAEHDLNMMPDNPCICIIGESSSGKSWIAADTLVKKSEKHIANSLVITPSDDAVFPYTCVHSGITIKKSYDHATMRKYIENPESGTIILDECITPNIWKNEFDTLFDLINNCKSSNKTLILVSHYPFADKKTMQSSFDRIFLTGDSCDLNVEMTYERCGYILPDCESFECIHRQLCTDFRSMVIANNNAPYLFDKMFYHTVHNLKGMIKQQTLQSS